MKVLCICEHGNVRSVALAYLLKTLFGHEAIAVGYKNISEETMSMLMNWSDIDINLEKWVGEDVWHDPRHPALLHKLYKKIREHKELWKK